MDSRAAPQLLRKGAGSSKSSPKIAPPPKNDPPPAKSGLIPPKLEPPGSEPPASKSGPPSGDPSPTSGDRPAPSSAKSEPAPKPGQEPAADPRVQEIVNAWARVTTEPPERHAVLLSDVRFTRFFIHAEGAIADEVRGVQVSGGHYCIVIRDPRDDRQNVGYLVDTHAEPRVVQLDNLSAFLLDLATGRIGEGAYILALRPTVGAAPDPRAAPAPDVRRTYTNQRIGERDLAFLDFRNNNCGAVATLGVGCLPPDDTYNLERAPFHEIHRFLLALSATYTIHAAYRPPPPVVVDPSQKGSEESELRTAWEQFIKELGERCEVVSFEDFKISVMLSRALAQKRKPSPSSSAGPPAFVHRWGCVQLVIQADGTPAKPDKALAGACLDVVRHSFPIAYRAALPDLQIDVDALWKRGLRLLAVPQSLFELILITCRRRTGKDTVTFAALDDHAQVVCVPEEVLLRRFAKRDEPVKLSNMHFVTYANQAVAHYLCARWSDKRLPLEVDVEAWLEIAEHLLAGIRLDKFASEHLLKVASDRYAAMTLSTIRLEHAPCGKAGPGFQLYRVTTDYTEDSTLERHEISYGASLFGGWIFDGPSNGSKSACIMAYLFRGGSKHNYYVLRIPLATWTARDTFADERRRLQSLVLPPVPICIQIFGFKGGFHPRMAKTEVAGIDALSNPNAIAFMQRFHMSYNRLAPSYPPISSFPAAKASKAKGTDAPPDKDADPKSSGDPKAPKVNDEDGVKKDAA